MSAEHPGQHKGGGSGFCGQKVCTVKIANNTEEHLIRVSLELQECRGEEETQGIGTGMEW